MVETLQKTLPILLQRTWGSSIIQGGNAWMKFEKGSVYIRVGPRYLGEDFKVWPCIQIANIGMYKERNGSFTRMVQVIRKITKWPLYLENTRGDFAKSLISSYGWVVVKNNETFDIMDLVLTGDGKRIISKNEE